jgi:transcriptional regulator with XRE-family HTH domain
VEHPVYPFGAVLRELRRDAGLTILAAAEAIGYGNYERWESGRTKVGGQYLQSIAEAFAVTDDLHLFLCAWVVDQITPDANSPTRRLGLDELRRHLRLAPDTLIDLHEHKDLVVESGQHFDLALLRFAARYAARHVVVVRPATRCDLPNRASGSPMLVQLYGDVRHDRSPAVSGRRSRSYAQSVATSPRHRATRRWRCDAPRREGNPESREQQTFVA